MTTWVVTASRFWGLSLYLTKSLRRLAWLASFLALGMLATPGRCADQAAAEQPQSPANETSASLSPANDPPVVDEATREADATPTVKRIVGATAVVAEKESELTFVARIDTGASSCSIHAEKWVIEDESPDMTANIGKKIRFLVRNGEQAEQWFERTIGDLVTIKTSERAERRYKVPMTLVCEGVAKKVLVSLNDRAHMRYSLLVGRNFLDGDFLVDVSK